MLMMLGMNVSVGVCMMGCWGFAHLSCCVLGVKVVVAFQHRRCKACSTAERTATNIVQAPIARAHRAPHAPCSSCLCSPLLAPAPTAPCSRCLLLTHAACPLCSCSLLPAPCSCSSHSCPCSLLFTPARARAPF